MEVAGLQLFKDHEKCKFFLVGFKGPESKHLKTYLYERRLNDITEEKDAEEAWQKVELAAFHFVLLNLDDPQNDMLLERLVESNRFTKTPIFIFSKNITVYRDSYANRKIMGHFLKMPINLSDFESELAGILETDDFARNQVTGMSSTLGHYTKGCKAYLEEDLKTAKEEIRLCLKENPKHIDAYVKMGDILIEMKDFPAAKRVLQKASQVDPKNIKVLYLIGSLELNEKNNDSAKSAFDKGVQLEPSNVQYIMDIGNTYMEHNMLEEALIYYNIAKKQAPDYMYIYNRIGIALSRVGRFEEAESEYKKAIEIDDNDAGIYFNMGMLEMRRKNKEGALENFKKTLFIDEDLEEAKKMIEKLSS